MSKESKSRDRHRQSIEAIRDRPATCNGCGWSTGHRADCLTHPADLTCAEPGCTATRKARTITPVWRYNPRRGFLCPTHKVEVPV